LKRSETLVRVMRGELAESAHRGHLAVADAQGRVLYELGDADVLVFARSAAKPLQAIAVAESGAADRFGLTGKEMAVICASHNGEPEHTATVLSILTKIGKTAGDLQCGAHEPYHKPTADRMKAFGLSPTHLHNNCSGKHAGMLAVAVAQGWAADGYVNAEHPVQKLMLETFAQMSGWPTDRIILGTDGCGVPVFGLPLAHLAAAYARLGSPDALEPKRGKTCRRIVDVIRSHPRMIAGRDRFDTQLIEATRGRIIGKMGAEGIFALTVPETGLGIALKIEDGAMRAVYPAIVEALRQLDLIAPAELARLESFHRPFVMNRRGEIVGRVEPDFRLRKPE